MSTTSGTVRLYAQRQTGPIDDPAKSRATGLPPGLVFAAKGELAIGLCTEVFADGIGVDFICGDEVYGSCTQLREKPIPVYGSVARKP